MAVLLKHASIITMNDRREILNDHALVIENDRILEIGESDAVEKKYPAAEKTDCRGKVLLPGFINLHTHQTLSMARGISEDLGTAPAYTKSVPQGQSLSVQECRTMAALGAAEAVRFGSTCLVDMYANCVTNAEAFETIGVRASVSEMLHDIDLYQVYRQVYETDEKMGEELLQRNVDAIEKYSSHPMIDCCLGLHAPDTCTEEYIGKILDLQEHYQVPIALHLAQSRGEVKRVADCGGASPVRFLDKMGVLTRRVFAAHCIFVDDADIRILSDRKTNVVHVPEGNAKGGLVAPVHKMRNTGINLTMGTDNCSADMIDAMRISLCVGRVMTGRFDNPTTMQVLEMATVNGAKALGKEKEIGSLEAGKKADILVLNYRKPHLIPCLNPLGILLHTAIGSDIETVFIDGKKVVDQGRLLTVDEESLIREAQEVARRQWLAVNHEIDPKLFLVL